MSDSLETSISNAISKLNEIKEYKEKIRQSVNDKGVELLETDPLDYYDWKINEIGDEEFGGISYLSNRPLKNVDRYVSMAGSYFTFIPSSMFASETGLTTASFPNCSIIYQSAFYACSNLTTLYFPECETIYERAFENCIGLSEIEFPKCTKLLGQILFGSCSHLTKVSFKTLESIGAWPFYSCSNIQKLYMLGSKVVLLSSATWYSTVTFGAYPSAIYVRGSLYDRYVLDATWITFSSKFVPYGYKLSISGPSMEGTVIKDDDGNLFYDYTSLYPVGSSITYTLMNQYWGMTTLTINDADIESEDSTITLEEGTDILVNYQEVRIRIKSEYAVYLKELIVSYNGMSLEVDYQDIIDELSGSESSTIEIPVIVSNPDFSTDTGISLTINAKFYSYSSLTKTTDISIRNNSTSVDIGSPKALTTNVVTMDYSDLSTCTTLLNNGNFVANDSLSCVQNSDESATSLYGHALGYIKFRTPSEIPDSSNISITYALQSSNSYDSGYLYIGTFINSTANGGTIKDGTTMYYQKSGTATYSCDGLLPDTDYYITFMVMKTNSTNSSSSDCYLRIYSVSYIE